jgi:hypothetical protein
MRNTRTCPCGKRTRPCCYIASSFEAATAPTFVAINKSLIIAVCNIQDGRV